MKKVTLAVLGLGNVPLAFLRYMQEEAPQSILTAAGVELIVTGVTTGTRGNAINPDGIPLRELERVGKKGDVASLNRGPETNDNAAFIESVPADILLVSTPASVSSVDEIRAAFARGMSVVTSNKTPVSEHFREFRREAAQSGVSFRFGATVLAGYPPWRHFFESIARPSITELQIVVNATSNQILTMMLKEGKTFEEGVAKAQGLGIAERDPSDDVDGRDTQKKLVIIANTLMDADLTPASVPTTGIREVTVERLRAADRSGQWIHLLGRAYRDGSGRVSAEVRPVALDNPFFVSMRGTSMGLYFKTPAVGFGIRLDLGPGERAIMATAAGVFEDILTIIAKA